ncbi:MAG: hypothetical protein KAW67_10340 [Candidatus Eisenbacteria sp.]|nr:hypothetical protein [Candidatus Eisenbacteria bacterium]
MRRVLLFCLVAAMVFAAGSASAQWNLGMRLVGTGNYFPYLPIMQAMDEEGGMVVADAGLFGYKEFAVGYHFDKLCFEGTFAYDQFGSTWTIDGYGDIEDDLTWWYLGGAVFYNFMKGDGYAAGAGLRVQYGASEMTHTQPYERTDVVYTLTGNSTQFSVPFRFMWRPGGGKFAIGPEVAFKYTTGATEYEEAIGGVSASTDGPEYTGFDTEYSLMMKFMF